MTNEKAFEKFILSDDWQEIRLHAQNSDELAENVWQAAISYMQEQSEPVASISAVYLATGMTPNISWLNKDTVPYVGMKLFTTPQRQQPLKRLDDKAIGDCLNKAELPTIMLNPILTKKLGNFANAIMGEMERINRG